MTNITILTRPGCSYCESAKQLLRQHRIAYREVDLVNGGEEATRLLTQSGRRTVPQIFIQQHPIGGYTELTEMIGNSEIDLARAN